MRPSVHSWNVRPAVRWGTRLILALALILFGAWLTSPKGEGIRTLCNNTLICPDPLVYLRAAERQPSQAGDPVPLNLEAGESREVTLLFDLNGVSLGTPINVVQVSRQWLNSSIGELFARPRGLGNSIVFYRDPDLTVSARRGYFQGQSLTVTVTASKDVRPSLSLLRLYVQKQNTRWGTQGSGAIRLLLHAQR